MDIDLNKSYLPHQPEYPIWVARTYITAIKNNNPGQDITEIVFVQTESMPKNSKDIIRKVAMDMFINEEI